MDIAAIITAVAALVAATASWRTNGKVRREFSPNHGSSMKDSQLRTESAVAAQSALIRSLGHQVGEVRNDARIIHEDHAARIRNLEHRL